MKLRVEANTLKDGSLSWKYIFEIAPVAGKRKVAQKAGFKTAKEAYMAGTKAQAEYYKTGKVDKDKKISVQDFFKIWIEKDCKVDLKDTTIESYEKRIKNHINPKLGKYILSNLTKEDLKAFIIDMFNDGYSLNTLSGIIGILTKSMAYAVDNDYIAVSPAIGLKIPKNRTPKTETRKEERIIVNPYQMQEIYNRFPEGSPSYLPLRIAYETGLRIGEVFGLVWEDIDFKNNVINVNRQIQWQADKTRSTKDKIKNNGKKEAGEGYWYFTNPKYDSFRRVEISEGLAAVLMKEYAKQVRMMAAYGEYYVRYCSKYPLQYSVTANVTGGPINPITDREATGNEVHFVCVRECGSYITLRTQLHTCKVINDNICPGFNFHSLRHTHTTMLLEQGLDIKYVSNRLGHKNIQVTLNIYTHISDQKREENAKRINDIYNQ